MPGGSSMAAHNRRHGLLQLGNVISGTAIQGLLHHRLFGTTAAAEGALDGGIAPQAAVDLDQAVGPG
jgi:hypothetical protein